MPFHVFNQLETYPEKPREGDSRIGGNMYYTVARGLWEGGLSGISPRRRRERCSGRDPAGRLITNITQRPEPLENGGVHRDRVGFYFADPGYFRHHDIEQLRVKRRILR